MNTEEGKTKTPNNLLLKILFSAFILIVLFSLLYLTISTKYKTDETKYFVATSTHPTYFFESDTFTDAIERVKTSDKKYPEPILGGVIPHHLLPSFIIADFFKNLAKQKPDTIILIGPNHYELGDEPILSSVEGWETPFGVVEPDQKILKDLYDEKIIGFDEKVLDREHSIGGIVPFIKYYIPDTKIVPIILSGYLTVDQINALVEAVAPKINKETVVVASVDFSHYQIRSKAEANDEITLKLMRAKDYSQMINLNSAYVDSPPSIVALLMIMEKKGIKDFNLIYNTNAGQILNNTSHEVTSYFSFVF